MISLTSFVLKNLERILNSEYGPGTFGRILVVLNTPIIGAGPL